MDAYAFPLHLYLITADNGESPIIQRLQAEDVEIKCIPLFTEQLLAERWMDAQKLDFPDLTMFKVIAADAVKYLEQIINQNAATHVSMDVLPNQVKGEWTWTIADAIRRLNQN